MTSNGKQINLTSDNITIQSTNFSVDKNGNIVAKGGTIGGFSLSDTQFTGNLSGIYNYDYFDANIAYAVWEQGLSTTSVSKNILDVNDSGTITVADAQTIFNIASGRQTSTKQITGKIKINSKDPKNILTIENNYGQKAVSIGMLGIDADIIRGRNIICRDGTSTSEVAETIINPNKIVTPIVQQTSLATQKKNFEKMQDNAIDIIKDIDIYKYNLKSEKDTDKKHLGFVIGDDYKYSQEVTSTDNQGVDNYSFTSLCCKAIQELAEKVEKLEEAR